MQFGEVRRSQKGVVMVAVLIIALAVAIFSYSLLITSIESLERSDVQDQRIKADVLVEGAIDEAAFAFKQDPDYIDLPENPGVLPQKAGGYADSERKKELISNEGTWQDLWDDLPQQTVRAAAAEYELTAHEYPDLYFVWGDMEEATYEFVDEYLYKRHYYDYHFNPYEQTSDIFIAAGAEVDDGVNDRVFSFGSREYPADITRFQVRTNDAWEPNENDPEPAYYETEHSSYELSTGIDYWTITYEYDEKHPGRNITGIDLLAVPGEVSLDSTGDFVWASGWNGYFFDPPAAPNIYQGQYVNAGTLFTLDIPSTSIRVGMISDGLPDFAPYDFGFKVSGIRYHFDSDRYAACYETPHPYDLLPGPAIPGDPFIQVIYAPFQFDSLDPMATSQTMRITFNWQFYLENGDMLRVINLAAAPPGPGILDDLFLADGAGKTYEAKRDNPDVPLAIALLFYSDGDNNASTDNYGYKASRMEYTDRYQNWVIRNNPTIETPHNDNLGSFIDPFDPAETMMYNTIHQPHVPGGGVLNSWWVHFDESCDLLAVHNADDDYIRISTPGFSPFSGPYADVHYFVDPAGPDGWRIPIWTAWHDVAILKDLDYPCGDAPFMEIYCRINNDGSYVNSSKNWGFGANEVFYSATDATDIAPEPPAIAAAISVRPDEGYTSFGSDPDSRGEWWVTEPDAEMVGVHINLDSYDLDPGDYLAFYDETGNEIGYITHKSYRPDRPDASGPYSDDEPEASGPYAGEPDTSGPGEGPGWDEGTIDLNVTKGWVLIPGESAHIVLYGDGDDNEGYTGFEVDRTAWWSGIVYYDTLGPFEKIDGLEEDVADYFITRSSEFTPIR